jgi:hypothetical protein
MTSMRNLFVVGSSIQPRSGKFTHIVQSDLNSPLKKDLDKQSLLLTLFVRHFQKQRL